MFNFFYGFIKCISFRKTLDPGPNPKAKTTRLGPEEAFECYTIPSTSRSLPTRSCNMKISYNEDENSSDNLDDGQSDTEEEGSEDCDGGYTSPDIDYEQIIEENLNNSPKDSSIKEKQENESENLLESAENCTKNDDQENIEEIPLENPICILLDQRNGQKRPVGITELQKVRKEADFEWNYTRLPLPSDYEYDPGCDYGSY